MTKIYDILKSGVCEVISDRDFIKLLLHKNNLVIKVGFDPTADILHLGHYLIFKKLKDFQLLGCTISIIIGDFTAAIGDPSGKTNVRKHISKVKIIENYKKYSGYIFNILDKNLVKIYFNSSWFDFVSFKEFIELASLCSVAKLLERSDFKIRYTSNKHISLHEFIYPVLQAYDSVLLNADIEIGGIDQKFNLLLARDFQKKFFQKQQVLIMIPILTGLDGINKMSKSLNNYISINENDYDMFCKIMSIPDCLMKEYFVNFGFYTVFEYDQLLLEIENLMNLKLDLAFKIVSLIYNKDKADIAKGKFINYFSMRKIDVDIETIDFFLNDMIVSLYDVCLHFNLIVSNSDFKRHLKQKSIKIDSIVICDKNFELKLNNIYLIQFGKKKVFKVRLIKK